MLKKKISIDVAMELLGKKSSIKKKDSDHKKQLKEILEIEKIEIKIDFLPSGENL